MTDWAQDYFERGYEQGWGLPPISDQIRLQVNGLIKRLNLGSGSRVVDIGCGHGIHAVALAEHNANVVGIDFAIALLTEAQHLGAQVATQPHWSVGTCDGCPFGLATSTLRLFQVVSSRSNLTLRQRLSLPRALVD